MRFLTGTGSSLDERAMITSPPPDGCHAQVLTARKSNAGSPSARVLILAPCSTTTAPIHATSTVVVAALNFIAPYLGASAEISTAIVQVMSTRSPTFTFASAALSSTREL